MVLLKVKNGTGSFNYKNYVFKAATIRAITNFSLSKIINTVTSKNNVMLVKCGYFNLRFNRSINDGR